jgi:hypothetical protein
MSSRRAPPALPAALLALALLAAACSDTTGLPGATITNTVDTVSLFALSAPNVQEPSAYELNGKVRVRPWQSTAFDFAFDFDTSGHPALFPTGAIHLGAASGVQDAKHAFDSVTVAPASGYMLDSALVVDTGKVVLVQSRQQVCVTGLTVSLYAKLRVIAVDTTARRLDFAILVDQNCGYLGLLPGLPTH